MFENLLNFRDLGGRVTAGGARIRPGALYRSESVAYLSEADVSRLVGDLGLATVVDLRGEKEVVRNGRGPLEHQPVRYLHVPITDVTRGLDSAVTFYVDMLTLRGNELAGMLRALLEPGALPAVVHCEAGCDRTGVLAAVVLSLLGVPDDAIAADYAATAAAMPRIHERVSVVVDRLGLPPRPAWVLDWTPEAAMMLQTLDLARARWGSIQDWAHTYGLKDDDLSALHAALVA